MGEDADDHEDDGAAAGAVGEAAGDPERMTFTAGLMSLIHEDGRLHHHLHHTGTVTARLSSASPNCQNIPRDDKSKVKRMFASRFGPADGMMLEVDYSQLEIICQAVLSRDPQLVADIRSGVDFHCKRLAAKLKEDYNEVKRIVKDATHPLHKQYVDARTKVKAFSFQRAYGAGVAAISEATGLSQKEVKQLIAQEDKTYSQVQRFNKWVRQEAEAFPCSASIIHTLKVTSQLRAAAAAANTRRRKPADQLWDALEKPFPIDGQTVGAYRLPTGTVCTFIKDPRRCAGPPSGSDDAPFGSMGFSQPQLMNYPVQALGGEIVQTMLGRLYRHFLSRDFYAAPGGPPRAFLINTVHDCVWIDCHKDVTTEVAADTLKVLQNVRPTLNTLYFGDLFIEVDFPVKVEAGPNLYDLHELQF
eukprot:NODE_318_length_1638_cov_122.505979_g239_i0.p1 GENE.NODE_318_length_1638_cov_122.505979_g239_i0~~NODE_318_length_1638_cov_122.505979_g239_i0.p1  ORF type:complete len:423 (-),score=170.54 NODE_318_length_1638_cov_122.505979_g239_i0:370-1617(-)